MSDHGPNIEWQDVDATTELEYSQAIESDKAATIAKSLFVKPSTRRLLKGPTNTFKEWRIAKALETGMIGSDSGKGVRLYRVPRMKVFQVERV